MLKKYALISLSLLLFPVLLSGESHRSDERIVSIYDDFDDGSYGRSLYRSVFRSVKLSAFQRSESFDVANPAQDEQSYLTAVVFSSQREEMLREGMYNEVQKGEDGLYHYSRKGLEFSFTLEKPGDEILQLIDQYYTGEYKIWHEQVMNQYKENFVIRIHKSENIFDPWRQQILYSEALLMATLLGDREQWLWGIHDGLDLLGEPF